MNRMVRCGVSAVACVAGTLCSVNAALAQLSPRQQFPVKHYSMEAFGCRSSAADAALEALVREAQEVSAALNQLKPVLRILFGLRRTTDEELSPADQARARELEHILSELEEQEAAIFKLPPCARAVIPVFNQGVLLGLYIIKVDSGIKIYERFIATDRLTNSFSDRHDPIGAGVSLAYGFAP
jgi:hypothetical protein